MPEPDEYKAYRNTLVQSMRRELFGPARDDTEDRLNEKLDVSPLQLYGTGILFPRKLRQNALEDTPENSEEDLQGELGSDEIEDDLDETPESFGKSNQTVSPTSPDSGIDDQPLNLANEYSPSALGITFRVHGSSQLRIDISFGTYTSEKISESHPRAGEFRADGSQYPEKREYLIYQRVPRRMQVDIPLNFDDKRGFVFTIPDTNKALRLHATLRATEDTDQVLSVMLVNHNEKGESGHADQQDAFFQAELEVRDAEGNPVFTQIDRPNGASSEEELASMDLLYRHRRAYCLGHGCAGDWQRGEEVERDGRTHSVWTATIPTHEVQPIEPREKPYGSGSLELSMKFLSGGEDTNNEETSRSILAALESLCRDYEEWIEEQEGLAEAFSGSMAVAADRHLLACRNCLDRMRAGIKILGDRSDNNPLTAFRLANRAMLMQQVHTGIEARELGSEFPELPKDYDEGSSRTRNWRPFQLAFVLLNVVGAANVEHADRNIVDLIWFPTGGGKTEAYLGLAAFIICLRRLRDPQNAGTTVLMRYTLRLLTAQQFQRASALTFALDTLRRERHLDADLGEESISIGLWVGQSLSPNKREDARAALRQMKQNPARAANPFQVLHCPWCKSELKNKEHYGYVEERMGAGQARTVRFRCPDQACPWSGGDTHMPLMVIDEDIYESPPTLVLGTVDKFAQVSWDDRVGKLFSIGLDFDPPDLIIQDELHLISGPLGTIVGLYETVIERFCQKNGRSPKIVASTATIRQAQEQCRALYDRETFEFPPQGLRAGDSYFAYENMDAPGRLYVGILASGLKSHATAQVRICSSLLQDVIPLPRKEGVENLAKSKGKDDADGNATASADPILDEGEYFPLADPYGTLIWYFNSLRELGYATTLCSGDIPEHLKSMCRRGKVPWDFRRRIRIYEELTSRRTADEIPEILEQLERRWLPKPDGGRWPVDILLATNMISVGVDVSRLGLMVVTGQPKSTSEYIQATSRVGRRHPGLVVTIYNQGRSRDRSHYEQFVAYHQAFYRFVEATSITPFSPPARERGLRGILIALARQIVGISEPGNLPEKREILEQEIVAIVDRIRSIDPGETDDAQVELIEALDHWEAVCPAEYGRMAGSVNTTTLAYPYGAPPDPVFHEKAWPILTSMRNVDGTAVAKVIQGYNLPYLDGAGEEGN
jgi:hypothetical protein